MKKIFLGIKWPDLKYKQPDSNSASVEILHHASFCAPQTKSTCFVLIKNFKDQMGRSSVETTGSKLGPMLQLLILLLRSPVRCKEICASKLFRIIVSIRTKDTVATVVAS